MHRSEYMDKAGLRVHGERTEAHRAYYAQYVDEDVKARVLRHIGLDALLRSRDEHLNDIPLKCWDTFVEMRMIPKSVADKLRENGDYLTLATGVCVMKEAARQIIEEQQSKEV
jgi:hypothetical protein